MKQTEPTWIRQGFKSQYEYQQNWVKTKGFDSMTEYKRVHGHVQIKEEWRVKDIEDGCPDEAKEIPQFPGYFITPDATIYHKSKMRKKWIIIKQQTQRSGYNVFQPYINGKRHVKYVHRSVISAFEGDRDANMWHCHHIDGDNRNNHYDNLMWMDKDEHRRLARGPYNK